jgi:hypothetical protein
MKRQYSYLEKPMGRLRPLPTKPNADTRERPIETDIFFLCRVDGDINAAKKKSAR